MKILRIFLASAVVLFIYESGIAQCVNYLYPENRASSIGILIGGGWTQAPYPIPSIASVINIWNSGCGGLMGFNIPALIENNTGSINIYIDYKTGRNPMPYAQWACARFNHRLDTSNHVVGGNIEFYEMANDGTDCATSGYAPMWDKVLAHEMGHVLGLADSQCGGYIMGPNWSSWSGPNSDECGWVDYGWIVSAYEQCLMTCETSCDSLGKCAPPPTACTGECCTEPCMDPLILDLEGDGIPTSTVQEGVRFDISGDGCPDLAAWTVAGAEDAILYFDHNHNGVIDGAKELLGDAVLLANGTRPASGFEALASYDVDGDGAITARDAVWGKLRLWIDRNHDGVMTNDENYSLGQQHVRELRLLYVAMTAGENYGIDQAGNQHRLKGTFTQRAAARDNDLIVSTMTLPMVDIFFHWRLAQ